MSQADGRYALIVGIADYSDPKLRKLRAPLADAERLARVLRNPDIGQFDVEVAINEEEAPLRRRIARFIGDRHPEDLLLIHFSCHGVKDESGELYLAARDTEIGHMLSATGISSAWLNEQIGRTRSKRVVVMLDCCFSGSFPFGVRARGGESIHVQEHLQGRGRTVITASSATEYAYEGDLLSGEGEPSFFTEAVVEGLETGEADRDGDKWISVDDLYEYVYERVKDRTPSQNPTKMSTLEGPLYLARSTFEAPIEPASLDDQPTALAKPVAPQSTPGPPQRLLAGTLTLPTAPVLSSIAVASGLATVGATFLPWYHEAACSGACRTYNLWFNVINRLHLAIWLSASACFVVALVLWTSRLKPSARPLRHSVASVVSLLSVGILFVALYDDGWTVVHVTFFVTLLLVILMTASTSALWILDRRTSRTATA